MFIVFSFTDNAGGLRRGNREVPIRIGSASENCLYSCRRQKQREQPEKDSDCNHTNNRLVARL